MPSNSTQKNHFPTLTTQRLILRPFLLTDAQRVQELAGHPKVAATTATVPHPYLDGMAEQWISFHGEWLEKGSAITLAVVLKDSDELIGCIDLMGISKQHQKAEIGYWIGVDYWNQGYCSEAMKAVVDYGFKSLALNKITCRHMSINPASGRVMLKSGLRHEGTLREEMFKDGRFVDMEVYGILKSEFKS